MMSGIACLAHGPGCQDVRHTFGPIEVWEERRDRMRLRRVAVGNHFLTQVLNGSFQPGKITSNLPDDAKIVSVRADPYRDCLVAWIWSSTFEPVDESAEVPEMVVVFTITTPDITLE